MSEQVRPQADIGVSYSYDNKLWVGHYLQDRKRIIANVGVRRDRLFFGYSVDFTLNSIQRSTFGSHEFIVADPLRRYPEEVPLARQILGFLF
jgi:hypothetical protein